MRALFFLLLGLASWAGVVVDFGFDNYVVTQKIIDRAQGVELRVKDIKSGKGIVCGAFSLSLSSRLEGEWYQPFGNALTMSAWVKLSKPQSAYARIVEFSDKSGHYRYSTALAFDSSGKIIRGWTSNAQGKRSVEVKFDLYNNGYMDGRWHHIAYVYDGGSAKLYIDGLLKDKKSTNIYDITDGRTLVVGGYYPDETKAKLIGMVDEVKIFDEALSSEEIAKLYRNEKEGREFNGEPKVCELLGDFWMDECRWGEVIDHSWYRRNAKARQASTVLEGFLCRGADFTLSEDGKVDLVELDPSILNGIEDFTIMAWIKTSQEGENRRFTILSGANEDTDNEVWFYFTDSNKFYPWIKNQRDGTISLPKALNDGVWHHIVWTRRGEQNCIVVDGDVEHKGCKSLPKGALHIEGLVLGQDQDRLLGGYESYQEFNGFMDELKIFSRALEDSEIEAIYMNESAHLNGDGSERVCECCEQRGYDGEVVPIEFEGDHITLPDTYKSPSWYYVPFRHRFQTVPVVFILINNYGTNPATARIRNVTTKGFEVSLVEPEGEDGPHWSQKLSYLAINEGVHKLGDIFIEVGKLETKKVQGRYASSQNDIGWDRISSKLSLCNPAVAANIQTLNNLESNPPKEPLIPWATVALRVVGKDIEVALDMSETTRGVFTRPETVGYILAPANVKSSFVDDEGKRIDFETLVGWNYFVGWDNGCRELPFQNSYKEAPLVAGAKISRREDDGGWMRLCKLDSKTVGLVVDEDRKADSERNHIAESGAVFAVSAPFVFTKQESQRSYMFDAWDEPSTKRLWSKIVLKPFRVTIAQVESNGSLRDFEGRVCAILFDEERQELLSEWNSTLWKRGEREKNLTFTPLKASKKARVYIYWDEKESCRTPFEHPNRESNSSDAFAVRPKEFVPLFEDSYFAAEPFVFEASALDGKGGASRGYNGRADVDVRMREPKSCEHLDAEFNLSFVSFSEGKARKSAKFDDVGEVNITLIDKEWTKVDSLKGDCNNSDSCWELLGGEGVDGSGRFCCVIEGRKSGVVIYPYRIEVAQADLRSSTNQPWLYMDSNLSEFNVSAWAWVRLLNKENRLLKNFDRECYAQDIGVKFTYSYAQADSGDEFRVLYRGDIDDTNGSLERLDKTLLFYRDDFFGGEGNKSYVFGIERLFYRPQSPLWLSLDRVSIKSAPPAKEEVNKSLNKSATFYYGRLKSADITTSSFEDNLELFIEVYDKKSSLYTRDFNQTSLYWYKMDWHTLESFGRLNRIDTKEDILLSSDDVRMDVQKELQRGLYTLKLYKPFDSNESYIHLDISPWLWFSYDKGAPYSYGPASSCANHPCVRYLYESEKIGGVLSGEVRGVVFEQNVTKKRRGVKVFR